METKDFNCKQEDVPAIAGFVTASFRRDLTDFSDFSSLFNEEYATGMETRRISCLQMVKSDHITGQMKQVTQTLYDKLPPLRLMMNKLEGYLELADGSLDIAIEDVGIKALRAEIKKENMEGIVTGGNSLITILTRNRAALQAKGMKADFITSLTTLINEIDSLNNDQNSKLSDRIQTTSDNIKEFNELWEMVTSVLKTGRLLYRGVDEVKLKDYTLAQLLKRINAEGGGDVAGTATTGGNN